MVGPLLYYFQKKMIGLLLKKRIIKQHNSHSKSLAICAIWLIFFLAIYVIWVVCKNEQNPLIKKHFSKLVSYFQARGQWRWKTPFWNRKHLWKTGCHIGSSSHHSLVLGKHNNQLSLISNQWGMIFILLGFFHVWNTWPWLLESKYIGCYLLRIPVVSTGYKDVQNYNQLSRNLQLLFEQSSMAKRGQLN